MLITLEYAVATDRYNGLKLKKMHRLREQIVMLENIRF